MLQRRCKPCCEPGVVQRADSTAHRHCACHTFACIAKFEDIRETRPIASSVSCSSTEGALTQSPHSFENLGVRN